MIRNLKEIRLKAVTKNTREEMLNETLPHRVEHQ